MKREWKSIGWLLKVMHFLMIYHPSQAMNLWILVAIHQRSDEQSFAEFLLAACLVVLVYYQHSFEAASQSSHFVGQRSSSVLMKKKKKRNS